MRSNYFLIPLFEHAMSIKEISDSREVREGRVRKSYSWDSVELERE